MKKPGRLIVVAALQLGAAGCVRAPSFNILGSYFPAWLFCIAIAIALTVVVRTVFNRTGFEQQLAPLVLVYPSLACLFAFAIWLLFFR